MAKRLAIDPDAAMTYPQISPGRLPRRAMDRVSRLVPRAVPTTALAEGTPARVDDPVISSTARVETVTAAMCAVEPRATPPKSTEVRRLRWSVHLTARRYRALWVARPARWGTGL